MYYDGNGRPDPSGDFVMQSGKLVRRTLRDGEHVRFDIMLRDGASAGSPLFLIDSQNFTDAERTLADSAEGRMIVAQAHASHQRRTAYLGDRAPEFSDAQAAGAIRSALAQKSGAQVFADRYAAETERLKADAATARRRRYTGC